MLHATLIWNHTQNVSNESFCPIKDNYYYDEQKHFCRLYFLLLWLKSSNFYAQLLRQHHFRTK